MLLLFWFMPNQSPLTSATLLCMIGFFVYGPQSLIGAAAANMATKRAAAAAVGLTGFFGYLSTVQFRVLESALGKTQWVGRRVLWCSSFVGLSAHCCLRFAGTARPRLS